MYMDTRRQLTGLCHVTCNTGYMHTHKHNYKHSDQCHTPNTHIHMHKQYRQEYIIEREGEYRTRVYYCGTTLRKVTHPLNDIHACKYKVLNRRQPRGYDLTFAMYIHARLLLHELMAIKKRSRPAIASTSSLPSCWIEATIE